MSLVRIHIQFGDGRTTISLDRMLFQLMALKLGHSPDEAVALPAVRAWLQERLPTKVGETGRHKQASRGARTLILEAVVDKDLSSRLDEWIVNQVGAGTARST